MTESAQTGKWTNRFVVATVLQGLLAVVLTAYLLYQAVFGVPAASRIVAGGGAGTWLTVGYLGYLILGLAGMAVMALLYRHVEVHLEKPFRGWANGFAWAHLVLWSVGVVGATWLMMHAGYRGGAAALPTFVGGLGWDGGQIHEAIMAAYPPYIAAFMALALLGIVLGAVGYLAVWLRPARATRPAGLAAGQ